ncbi:hypothetical protein [Streptomyces sp. NPDC086782]|uniref:hypothetical protein n=1 Tax=Streptomyces sp. NPDC086782 TaxID=3365757 RepID=UPI00380CA2A6
MADTVADLAGRIAALERLVRDMARSSRLANSSIENGSLSVYDELGLLRGSWGLQDDGTFAMAAVNGPPPPIPSTPTITSVLGGIAVTWDGSFADGSDAPADFSYVEVHFATSSDFNDGLLFAACYSNAGGTITVPASGPVWVRLVCASTSGVESEPSEVAGPVGPLPVVAQEVLDGIVNELSLADGAVTRAKLEAGAVDGTVLADGAVTTPKLVAGEIDGLVLAAGTVNADRLVAASITAAQVKALSLTGDRLAFNTVTADQLATGTITAASGVISSIDASVITVGKIKASQLDAAAIDGRVITGSTLQTAASGNRVWVGQAGGGGFMRFYSGSTKEVAPGFVQGSVTGDGSDMAMPQLLLQGPTVTGVPPLLQLWSDPEFRQSRMSMYADYIDLGNGAKSVVEVSGILQARNMAFGTVSITPSAPNTPTSVMVQGLNLTGTTFRPYVTVSSTVVGTAVLGVSATSPSRTGLTVWLTRTNTTATNVYWMLIGS